MCKKPSRITVKCPWCGRTGVRLTKKGGLEPHITPGVVQRCVGTGMSPYIGKALPGE